MSVTVTLTAGTTAPLGSLTISEMDAVGVCTCEMAAANRISEKRLRLFLRCDTIGPQFADKRRGPVGKVVSDALNALAEAESEVRQDFAGSKKISPLRCGMPLRSQQGETKKNLTHGIADAF